MLPLVGAISNIESESNFASFRSLWQTARKMWPNVWVTVAVPEHQFKKFAEVLTEHERMYLELMPEPDVLAQFHVQETQFDPRVINRFNRYNGTDWVDLVITSRLMIGQQLLCGMGDWRGMAGSPVVGLYEPGVAQDRLPHNAITRPGMLMKVLSVAACPTQFLTQEEVDKLLAWARQVASPSALYDVLQHSEIIQPVVGGVADDPVTAPNQHMLFFGGRFSVGKNIPFLFDVYADAFALGRNVRIVATCPSVIKQQYRRLAQEKGNGPDGQPLIQLIRKCGREEFHRHASQATIGLIASFHEGYPSGFIEMAVKGQLTLFPDERWARDSLPSDYPWFYKNRAEAHALIKRGLTWEWTSMVKRQLACLRPHHAHCLEVSERILTSDLRWVPSGELQVGDCLIGFDEAPTTTVHAAERPRRRWRLTEITAATTELAECVKVTLTDGTSVVCTPEHPWLVDPNGGLDDSRHRRFIRADRLMTAGKGRYDIRRGPRRGHFVLRALRTWEPDTSRDAGWLAGMFDGEGHLRVNDATTCVTQREGLLLDELKRMISAKGFKWMHESGRRDVPSLRIAGGFDETLRFLGLIRPARLLRDFRRKYRHGQSVYVLERVQVVSVEPVGRREIRRISTGEKTYVGNGFLMHNCDTSYHERRLQFWADPKWATELSQPRRAPQEISEMLIDFAKDRETFTLEEACAGITERSRAISKASWDHPPARFWCRPGVAHELLQLGFEDICDGPTCRYRRVEVVEEESNGEELVEEARG